MNQAKDQDSQRLQLANHLKLTEDLWQKLYYVKWNPKSFAMLARLAQEMLKSAQTCEDDRLINLTAQLERTRQEANSASATARARCIEAEQARREADRQQKLLVRKLVSEEQVDQAVSAANAGDAACEAAGSTAAVSRARIGVAEAMLEKTRLIAPFDGVVAEINGELNEYVTPSPIGIPTPPAVDLIENRCFYMTAPIDEVDVAGIAVGQTARITLDAFGDRRFNGVVTDGQMMELFEARTNAHQNFDRIFLGRLFDRNRLEASFQSSITFNVFAVLF